MSSVGGLESQWVPVQGNDNELSMREWEVRVLLLWAGFGGELLAKRLRWALEKERRRVGWSMADTTTWRVGKFFSALKRTWSGDYSGGTEGCGFLA